MIAISAFWSGVMQVVRAPFTLAAVVLLTVVTVVPFGLVMGSRLQSALNDQPPVMLGAEEIDADWWLEFRRHARGLDATFTPAIIGFAAPLSNLSTLLDGTPQDWVMAGPIVVAMATWAFIWGWAIERFRSGGSKNAAALLRSGLRAWPRFMLIGIAAAVAQLVLYLTIHALLFGPVYSALTASMTRERDAFIVRAILYLIFGACVATVSVVADYSRIASMLRGPSGPAFARRWSMPVAVLCLTSVLILGVVLLAYGVGETYGGSRVAGWRGVAIGQAFIIGRLALRLISIAAEVRLYKRLAPPLVSPYRAHR
jgi:hypothetical protein